MAADKTHYAKTRASDQTFNLYFNDDLILESNQAIELSEHYDGKDFAPVIYFPESVVSVLPTSRSDFSTFCPIKGEASYLSFRDSANSIWYYPEPFPQVSQIKGYYGFSQSKGFRVQLAG
ncbi:MAG: DUF427 domain-containing protein [Gammaproteobacteria bacterium]|nr:DUF427 domain-containing protein [Gammaproteobacteria bacterium]